MSDVIMNNVENQKINTESLNNVQSIKNKRIILGVLPTEEWLIYIQDPESYCKRFECGQAYSSTLHHA